MNYIIMDLEWNQAVAAAKMVRSPVILNGEVIQIGAVKTDENFTLIDKIKINVRPRYYKIMNPHVAKLTGITQLQLTAGESFPQAFRRFAQWCGEDYRVITWGSDDKEIFLNNMALHGIKEKFCEDFINLQLIYNSQVQHEHLQTALSAAAENVGITVDVQCHDAFNDAYLTWQLCGRLNMRQGIAEYSSYVNTIPTPLFRDSVQKIEEPRKMLRDSRVMNIVCPHCGGRLEFSEWLFSSGKSCKTIARCEACGESGVFLARLKALKIADGDYMVTRSVYAASEEDKESYNLKIKRRREWREFNRRKKEQKEAADKNTDGGTEE